MKQSLVFKARIYLYSDEQSNTLSSLQYWFTRACNYGSRVFFDNIGCRKAANRKWNQNHKRKRYNNDLTAMQLQKKIYRRIRKAYHLKSELACAVPRVVVARYRAVKTQMKNEPRSYQDRYTHKWHHYYRRLEDLWHPIAFHTPQAVLTRGRDWSFTHDRQNHQVLSLNTLGRRIKVRYFIPSYFKKYLKYPLKYGAAQVLHKRNHWTVHIAVQVTVPDMGKIRNVVGSDRGLNQLIIISIRIMSVVIVENTPALTT